MSRGYACSLRSLVISSAETSVKILITSSDVIHGSYRPFNYWFLGVSRNRKDRHLQTTFHDGVELVKAQIVLGMFNKGTESSIEYLGSKGIEVHLRLLLH